MKIIVVGDAGLDVLVRHEGEIVQGDDTPAQVRIAGGGSGANTALWLAACGVEPVLVTRVGDDTGGRLVRADLEAAGVRCLFTVDGRAATFSPVVLVDGAGERTILGERGACARLTPGDVEAAFEAAVAEGASHLHLSGYVLLDPRSRDAGLAALAAAREAGLTTSVDPQSEALLAGSGTFLDDVRGAGLLLPNTGELRALTGSPEPASAVGLLDTVGAVAVTAGRDGASWVDADGIITVPAAPAACRDSTGAGDAFNAGVLAALVRGKSIMDTLAAGIASATKAIGRIGAQP
ncbi:carbohydrate kinase family protein [Amycolatopsis pigmentata]|uniref:Carbohydrate kinase family protein n=1 Tax=Amycolatopsis pigmentata TaxID=450801 RepID=A0ABW5FXI9_9PSEU